MIRLIIRETDIVDAVHADANSHTSYRTFDVELLEVESWLAYRGPGGYITREVVGVELRDKEPEKS